MTFRQKLQQRAVKNSSTKALKRFTPHDIILAPILTEKTHSQQEDHKYAFKVHKDANKNDVKMAIAYLYHVSPIKVNIISVPYKWRFQRKLVRSDYKKAIVTLSQNEKIEVGV